MSNINLKQRKMVDKIAEVIIKQLGGNNFLAITGIKNFVWDEKQFELDFVSLSLLGQEKVRVANKIRIEKESLAYDNEDLYEISLFRYRDSNYFWESQTSVSGFSFDNLQEVFSRIMEHLEIWTGLNTNL